MEDKKLLLSLADTLFKAKLITPSEKLKIIDIIERQDGDINV